MGKLGYSTIKYLSENLQRHDKVISCDLISGPDEDPILRIERTNGLPVTVHVVWAYEFSFAEYLVLAERVSRGDFILAAGFGGESDEVQASIIEHGRKNGIGIGNLRRLFGALNYRDVSKYQTRAEKDHNF